MYNRVQCKLNKYCNKKHNKGEIKGVVQAKEEKAESKCNYNLYTQNKSQTIV